MTIPLFDPHCLARTSDPQTSHDAAASIVPHLPRLQRQALEAVAMTPGRTSTELARLHGVHDPRVYNRRLTELARLGLVVRGAARRCSVTGRSAATWVMPPAERGAAS